MKRWAAVITLAIAAIVAPVEARASVKALPPRRTISLDGVWQIDQGSMDVAPKVFSHQVVVPGLVDMAQPAFEDVGRKSPLRQAFWYRRTFCIDGPIPAIAQLKVHKARYGMKVLVNGQAVGESLACFTPAYFEVGKHLKGNGQSNEILVRLGADRECIPPDMPSGWDFEKLFYFPGIFDSVELILTGVPYIVNVQAVPMIEARQVRIVAEVQTGTQSRDIVLDAQVVEAVSGKSVGAGKAKAPPGETPDCSRLELTIPIEKCRLWSPDAPFLYELRLSTGTDAMSTRFGMRSFRFDPETKRAVLNGQPCYLRGSNVCIYRFFDDAERGDRPWRAEWVRRFHQRLKSMHWQMLRYCIGFPPEQWYDIADELGFLIQDEFPIWLFEKTAPENPTAENIIPQYTDWMRERWNHPCVVIWDAQNESQTEESGKALAAVRHLDLSDRPWDNGWGVPQSPTDCTESHPYLFSRGWKGEAPFFKLKELSTGARVPHLNAQQKKVDVPILINEYDWLWLNRDGSPTSVDHLYYEHALGKDSTIAQRRMLHARYVAALTEFWRCHRKAAGVLHFCALGYSRDSSEPYPKGGGTSDDFIDMEQLTLEPLFAEYVGEAFNPLGLMLNFWDEALPAGSKRPFEIYVVNDRSEPWQGDVRLCIIHDGKTLSAESQTCQVASLGRKMLAIQQTVPAVAGEYQIVAELTDTGGNVVRSLRDFKVPPAR